MTILGMLVVSLTTVSVQKQALAAPEDTQANVTKRLQRFDQLYFDAFSKQDWKLFNEIQSDYAGTVVRIIPENGELVSQGEELFWIEP